MSMMLRTSTARPAATLATLLLSAALTAQTTQQSPTTTTQVGDTTVQGSSQTTIDANGSKTVSATAELSRKPKKERVAKDERVKQSKDTKAAEKKNTKLAAATKGDQNLPDKQLYDKALAQLKSGHYDVARLDLQTMLNTYPDSQYQMKAKLAVADSWYREGGSAALMQAEQEYRDFITFFPNAPETAEAQLRMGDIYFKQMDIPDRDYTKAIHAEEEYRTLLKQYPDAPKKVLDTGRQRLRDVQEVLASREAYIAQFYSTHNNWPASIARYQTVVDTYPMYSHMDDTLLGLGDAYEAEANLARNSRTCQGTGPQASCLPEGAKAWLEQHYDGLAAEAYRKVVLEHAAAPHVEDAKERLTGMNLPVPKPTAEQVAASEQLEGSRAQYTMTRRLLLLINHKPDTVLAATHGDPTLDDPTATTAPAVVEALQQDYIRALNPNAPVTPAKNVLSDGSAATPETPAAPAAPAAPLALSDVGTSGQSGDPTATTTLTSGSSTPSAGGSGVGVEIVSTGEGTVKHATDLPAASGKQDPNYGLKTVAPTNNSALPPIEKPGEAPDTVNEAQGKAPNGTVVNPDDANRKKKKTKAPAVDKADESSSKKKKGLEKINPF